MSLMRDPDEPNEAYTAAHAIAGFQLADIAFGGSRKEWDFTEI